MTSARLVRISALALAAGIALASIVPIRNYDLFWHLATGRWIVEHTSLPSTDPFAVASERHPWINGEWLFQVIAYGIESVGGIGAFSIARALFAGALFGLIFFLARRDSDPFSTLAVTAFSFAGAAATLDFRPASIAMLFVVLAICARSAPAHAIVSAVWINVHPSALLAPAIAAMTTRRIAPVVASAIALLVNPYGWHAIAAPLRLMSFVSSGEFVNAEWLPSRITQFPLLYVLAIGGGLALLLRRADWWRVLLFAGFAFLAVRHVRNQPLFYAALPLLVAPVLPSIRRSLAVVAASAAVALVAMTADHRIGVAPERFPVRAVAMLRDTGLKGTIYNPDQFGGLIIWSFYPERRAITDGRNELYRSYIAEYARARGDQRAWRELLARYRVDLAVDEYRAPLQVVDARTRRVRSMPASLAYWPRNEWALIGFDEAAMVFARRTAFEPSVIGALEMRGVIPDAEAAANRATH